MIRRFSIFSAVFVILGIYAWAQTGSLPTGQYFLTMKRSANGAVEQTINISVTHNGNNLSISSAKSTAPITGTLVNNQFTAHLQQDGTLDMHGTCAGNQVTGTFVLKSSDGSTTNGAFTIAKPTPTAHKPKELKQYGTTSSTASSNESWWQKVKDWCDGFKL